MSDSSASPGLGDLLGLLGGANPFSGIGKSITQFQRGVTQFLDSIETFNATMAQLNEVAGRVNTLLDDVEPTIRALMPQITRTLKATDSMVDQMTALPKDLGEFMNVIGDVARRLQPLGQLAETAGGLFGLRPLAALRSGGERPPPPAPPPPPSPPKKAPAKKAPAKRAPAKKP
jgi:ABC-type transporter Mla subunit MlaD